MTAAEAVTVIGTRVATVERTSMTIWRLITVTADTLKGGVLIAVLVTTDETHNLVIGFLVDEAAVLIRKILLVNQFVTIALHENGKAISHRQ